MYVERFVFLLIVPFGVISCNPNDMYCFIMQSNPIRDGTAMFWRCKENHSQKLQMYDENHDFGDVSLFGQQTAILKKVVKKTNRLVCPTRRKIC